MKKERIGGEWKDNDDYYQKINKKSEELLKFLKAEQNFSSAVLDTVGSLVVVLTPQGKIMRINQSCRQVTGFLSEEVEGKFYWDVFIPPQEVELEKAFFEALQPDCFPYKFENQWVMKDGSVRDILWSNTAILDESGNVQYFISAGMDITERKKAEETLREANEKLRALIHASPLAVITLDSEGRITSWSSASERIFGWREKEVLGLFPPMIPEEEREAFTTLHRDTFQGRSFTSGQKRYLRKNAQPVDLNLSTAPLRSKGGQVQGIMLIAQDITRHKQAEEKIKYLSFHDKLTDLYNRAFFEEELQRLNTERQLPLSVIIGDVNGLKLVNDAFGHKEGDNLLQTIGDILRRSFRKEDIVCRWGGDEFAILLPKTPYEIALTLVGRVKAACQDVNCTPIHLNIALGVATKVHPNEELEDVIKEAEAKMYFNKMSEAKNFRISTIASLLHSLGQKGFETEEHIWRMQVLAVEMGDGLQLNDTQLDNLTCAVAMHDIGKMALPEEILLKPGPLSPQEQFIVQKHSERGYHIALSSVELAFLAPVILAHHERWDGKGYPQGLKGEGIPLLSRIIAIIDTYDVMTNDQIYKKAVSRQEALAEIERYAGSQFDPVLAKIFLNLNIVTSGGGK